MRSNRFKAPPSYRENAQARPAREGRSAPPPRTIRIYICVHCRRPGGTLQNIGTHREPIYIHPDCRRFLDKLLPGRRQLEPDIAIGASEDEEKHIDAVNREMSHPPEHQEKVA